jgi:RNA polymerase sigma-70 factor (ECF subfamily)
LTATSASEVSQLLINWGQGDESALEKLIPLVYDELRKMAHFQMARENQGHTLQTTALANEVCLRLLGGAEVSWKDRAHFLALSAKLMRRVLVDHARGRGRVKRGGAMIKMSLDDSLAVPVDQDTNIIALDDALSSLAMVDARKAKTVELRFFGGYSVEETAKILNVSVRTVMNDWKFAKVWLLRSLQKDFHADES